MQELFGLRKGDFLKEFDVKSFEAFYGLKDKSIIYVSLSQLDEDSQVTRPAQAEEDHYEMNVRASNIVSF